jgi:hypothetical protein
MMMMNCPVADVALMILPGGRETSHHQDSWHIPPIEGCLRLLELFTIIMYCSTELIRPRCVSTLSPWLTLLLVLRKKLCISSYTIK